MKLKFFKRSTLMVTSLVLAVSSLSAVMPLFLSQNAHAIVSSEVVYNALPAVTPHTNYASLGYEATSTSEFGDSIHIGGTNRILNTVTVTMSDWAKYSDYSTNPIYDTNTSTWSMPITLNVYSNHLGTNGAPDTILTTKTQTFSVPWRPESDPTCASTSNGNGWKEAGVCYNFSGITSNITFDLSSFSTTLPSDVILGVAYNTQTHGYAPTGLAGPYNSLNVAIPDNQAVSVGSDNSTDNVFFNTSYAPFYADGGSAGVGIFRQDTNWSPNGTVAFQVTATAPLPPAAPTDARWLNHQGDVLGAFTNVNQVTPSWTAPTTGADHYNYSFTSPTNLSWSAPVAFSGTSIPDQVFNGAGNNGTEGAWQFSVQSVGALGDVSAWVESAPLTYDKTAPTGLENLSPADGTHSTTAGLTQITWKAASDLNGPINYYYESSLTSATNSDRSFVNPVYQSGALTDTSIPTTNTPAGVYYWHVRAVDAANNYTAWTRAWMVTIDNTKPAIPTFVMKDANSNVVTNGYINTQNFTFALTNPSADGVVRYQLQYLDETSGLTWNPTDLSAAGHMNTLGLYTDNFTQGEGTHSFAFSACDAAGNCSAFTTPFVVTYDKTAPQNVVLTPGNGTYGRIASNGATITANATSDDTSATYVYKLTNNGTNTVVTNVNNIWDATTLANGTYTLSVVATDKAGNTSTAKTSTITVDNTPVVVVTGKTTTTNTISPIVTVDGTDAPTIGYTYAWTSASDPSTVVSTDAEPTFTPTVAGNYVYDLVVKDGLGNPSVVQEFGFTYAPVVVTTTTPTPVFTGVFTNPTTTNLGTPAVLGTSTTNNTNTPTTTGATDVKGASTQKPADTQSGWALAWYWWVLILVAIAGFIWWLFARRRNQDA
jgi:hypothetical protein